MNIKIMYVRESTGEDVCVCVCVWDEKLLILTTICRLQNVVYPKKKVVIKEYFS